MTDVKPIGISPSQQQPQQPQQQQSQQQSQQQMMIATHELQQQQNVQAQAQQSQQHVQPQQQQSQQVQQQSQQVQQQVQAQQQTQQQMQQQQQQQTQQNNGQHNVVPAQVQVQSQVAASMPQQQLQNAVAVSMQQAMHQQQGGVSMTLSGQQGATTITTMAAHPQAVQVIQQPIQSQAYHLQQLYNTQGTPLLMPGNLALHPAVNPSSIQVITAGKPFQSAAQLTPHMLTTASTPGQGGAHPGAGGTKVQGFPAGYLPVPTSATPGAGQTLVFGQLDVLGSPQPPPSLQQQQQQQSANKQDQVQKYATCTTGTPSGGRSAGMQFAAPWQFAPQVWTAGLQPPTILTAAPNQIFLRGPTQPDMFIQSPQPIQAHNALATQQQIHGVQQIAATSGKPKVMDIQQQQSQQSKQNVTGQRPLSILPSSLQVQAANIRAASSVSTQTVHGVQATVQAQSGKATGSTGKGRKPMQAPQQQQQQPQQASQPPIQHQLVFIQQKQHTQQQQQQLQQQYQQQVQSAQQQIQPKPIMTNMTLQQQQQPGVVLGTDRPIMPVVSVGGVGVGVATTSQMNQVPQTAMSAVQQLPLSAINPTIIGNQILSGTSQVQAMPIVNTAQDQQTHDNTNSTIMIASPERNNSQAECSLMPTTNSSIGNDDTLKTLLSKKEEVSITADEITILPIEIADGDQCKTVAVKEEEALTQKVEEKQCNNPLAGLANAVNAITNGVSNDESSNMPVAVPVTVNSKQAPPKAMVKPQVLTHVIEGFVIQEASEPFAVSQDTTNAVNRNNTATERETLEEPPRKKHIPNYPNEEDGSSRPTSKCENCDKVIDEQNIKFKKEKRFCSSLCAKSKKRELRDRDNKLEKQWTGGETETKTVENDVTKKNGEERSLSMSTTSSVDESLPKVNPVKWTVNEVCDFIRGLPGCADYAEDFAIQEIDGQALMLLKEDHLMSAMSIKLGPALKIVAKIDSMRVDTNSNPTSNSS